MLALGEGQKSVVEANDSLLLRNGRDEVVTVDQVEVCDSLIHTLVQLEDWNLACFLNICSDLKDHEAPFQVAAHDFVSVAIESQFLDASLLWVCSVGFDHMAKLI